MVAESFTEIHEVEDSNTDINDETLANPNLKPVEIYSLNISASISCESKSRLQLTKS